MLRQIVILTSHSCRGRRSPTGGAQKCYYAGHPSQKHLECAGFSPAAVMCHPSSRPLCKCEPCSLCVHLPVLTLIHLHIYTCPLLCWCSALRGGHMLPLLSQTKPLNPSDICLSQQALCDESDASCSLLFTSLASF